MTTPWTTAVANAHRERVSEQERMLRCTERAGNCRCIREVGHIAEHRCAHGFTWRDEKPGRP